MRRVLQEYAVRDQAAALAARETAGNGNGGSQTVQIESVPVSSADLLALHTTPKVLLPAPGGRLYHIVDAVIVHYRFGTTPYAGVFSPVFAFGDTIADYTSGGGSFNGPGLAFQPQPYNGLDGQSYDLLTFTEDAYFYVVGTSPLQANVGPWTSWKASQIEDKAFSMANLDIDDASAEQLTLGDGTLTVRVFYTTIDGAP